MIVQCCHRFCVATLYVQRSDSAASAGRDVWKYGHMRARGASLPTQRTPLQGCGSGRVHQALPCDSEVAEITAGMKP
jgi:hypothetical protein